MIYSSEAFRVFPLSTIKQSASFKMVVFGIICYYHYTLFVDVRLTRPLVIHNVKPKVKLLFFFNQANPIITTQKVIYFIVLGLLNFRYLDYDLLLIIYNNLTAQKLLF